MDKRAIFFKKNNYAFYSGGAGFCRQLVSVVERVRYLVCIFKACPIKKAPITTVIGAFYSA
jgi:hypothetical protein